MSNSNYITLTNKAIILTRFVTLFLILSCSYAFSESNSLNEIEKFAESLVFSKYKMLFTPKNNEKIYIKAAPLGKHLNFPVCNTNLTGEVVGNKIKKNTSVKVTCSSPEAWSTYVRVRVQLLVPAIVTSQALSKGEVLLPSNIKSIHIDKSQVRNGSFINANTLIGTRLKRNLSTNKIIRDRDICFVCKNDKVTIYANKNGLSIKASGIALSDANIGRTVRIKNSRTQRIVVGTVSALKEVQVSF